MTAEEVADGILERERGDGVKGGVADPSIFAENGGPSIGERMSRRGVHFRPGDNTRVGRDGHIGGWDQVRARLKGDDDGPMLLAFETCREFIRTFPALQQDPDQPEDILHESEAHAPDAARYAAMSRPYILPAPVPKRRRRDDYGWDADLRHAGTGWAS